jgi:hypothetical protein
MASAVDTTKIRAQRQVILERFVGTAGAMASVYRPLTGVRKVLGGAALITKTGNGLTKVELVAAEDASGTNATAIKDSGTIAADAVGTSGSVVPDQAFVEMSANELKTLERTTGFTFTHFALRVTAHNAGDIIAGVIEIEGAHQKDDLTPATTIA